MNRPTACIRDLDAITSASASASASQQGKCRNALLVDLPPATHIDTALSFANLKLVDLPDAQAPYLSQKSP
jgi:hypothetical protein